MSLTKVPSYSAVSDEQFVTITGPDGLTTGMQFDAQQRSFYLKESQVIIPSFHGMTHIAEDPIPDATCDTPGLMAADDKCKLDALLQTRVGVIGYMGAGFPDDGGWMQGDITLAAGGGFLSIERLGSVIRFNVDSPLPLNCGCETCSQIFWVQDETSISSIRPPSCGGKMPGINAYNEIKFFLFPESAILDPANPSVTLNQSGNYPALTFTRYNNSVTPGLAEHQVILRRDSENYTQTIVGWAMTPGPADIPECVWFMGLDDDNNLIRFDLNPNSAPGLLGNLLYRGHNLTKAMAVITSYTSTILSTNQYNLKMWDVDGGEVVGDEFVATNQWQYDNPESTAVSTDTKALVLDATVDVLAIGTLVDLWFFQVGEVAGVPIRRYYFSKQPQINPANIWGLVGGVEFGDEFVARQEVQPGAGDQDTASEAVSGLRNFEQTVWGLTGVDDPLILLDAATASGPDDSLILNTQHRATIDPTVPALIVESAGEADPFSERPVMLWNRAPLANVLGKVQLGRPSVEGFSPYDILFHAPIDSTPTIYLQVKSVETFTSPSTTETDYLVVKGAWFNQLPSFGAIRLITGAGVNATWNYTKKMVFPGTDTDAIGLAGGEVPAGIAAGDIVEVLHQEYSAPCVRVEFTVDTTVSVQFRVGTLDMSKVYEGDDAAAEDDFVRGFADGWYTSATYIQNATFSGSGTAPGSNVDGFVVYDGGTVSGTEYWNTLEVMQRGNQVWVWWNNLLIPPSSALSEGTVSTPYYPFEQATTYGKFGMRLWPGAKVRRAEVRSQIKNMSEFTYGQLQLT